MNKDKNKVVERLRSKIQPENRIFVRKNLAISAQVEILLKEKGWSQKELAKQLRKTESEVSRMLSGLHNLTLKSLAKLEAVLGNEIVVTPLEACKKYKSTEYVTLKVYVPVKIHEDESVLVDYVEESNIEYQKTYTKQTV
ncbi:MAG: helix-turn-helix transcriptional regulator [Porphyromonadaceae bacterium]|nr:helix-turn-helix transcriptional regulator [Porphyromonadaceae bacterium]